VPVRATMQGGIIDKDMPLPVSAVAIICSKDGPTRIGYEFDATGTSSASARSVGRSYESHRRPPNARGFVALRRRDPRQQLKESSASRT
jgi:ribosomal protein L24